jgi:hypothetical protein
VFRLNDSPTNGMCSARDRSPRWADHDIPAVIARSASRARGCASTVGIGKQFLQPRPEDGRQPCGRAGVDQPDVDHVAKVGAIPLAGVALRSVHEDVDAEREGVHEAHALERGGQWSKGKSCDNFLPLGPWLVTADEVGDPQKLGLTLEVNGVRRQNGSTATMTFDVWHIVHYLSQFITLEAGDVVTLAIDGLGSQRSTCEPA